MSGQESSSPAPVSSGGLSAAPFMIVGALLCLAAGAIIGRVSGGDGTWYRALEKPPGTPPAAVFGPVWSVLYLMIGAAGGLLAKKRARKALGWFGVQLALNLAWSPVFFHLQQPVPALAIIIALLAAIAVTIRHARRVSEAAAFLLVPYGLWVCYATYLNAGFVLLN